MATTSARPETTGVEAAQVPIPKTPAQVSGPFPGNIMTEAYVQLVGRMAFIWGYALVNAHNRRLAFSQAPEPGLLGGVVPFAPVGYNAMLSDYISPDEQFIVCPNQDVVYGGGFTALDKEPTVVQVPDFGDRFMTSIGRTTIERIAITPRSANSRGQRSQAFTCSSDGPNWNRRGSGRHQSDVVHVRLRSDAPLPRIFRDRYA